VAKEYRVSPQVVASLVHKAKRNKQFLKELLDARCLYDRQLETIKQTVGALNQSRSIISSAQEVVTKVNVHAEAPVSEK
jgi:prefoldin subunit 5